jgi:3-dehydroquinate dehydratase-2|tara:strand:- start:72 stop:515 length:444 start_codon:yes stop_codon:yes gene_type:complete
MRTILLINGPNLNNLGNRDESQYGSTTLDEIINELKEKSDKFNTKIIPFQSNHEGEIVDFIQKTSKSSDGVIINAGALSQVGYSILDALIDSKLPYIEVHISNIYSREIFRHKSVLSANAVGQICGLENFGYSYALDYLVKYLSKQK